MKIPDTISERRDFNVELYQEAQALMRVWVQRMKEKLADPEGCSAADYANVQKFLKDNCVTIEIPMPVADATMPLEDEEDLPSFLRKDDFLKEGRD